MKQQSHFSFRDHFSLEASYWWSYFSDPLSPRGSKFETTKQSQPPDSSIKSRTLSWIVLKLHSELAPLGNYKIREGQLPATRSRRAIRRRVSRA